MYLFLFLILFALSDYISSDYLFLAFLSCCFHENISFILRQYVEALNRPVWFVNPTSPMGRVNQCTAIRLPISSETDIFILRTQSLSSRSSIRSQGNWTDLLVKFLLSNNLFPQEKKNPIGIWPQNVLNLVPPTRDGLCRVWAHMHNNIGTCRIATMPVWLYRLVL